jgi:hypothetical protein
VHFGDLSQYGLPVGIVSAENRSWQGSKRGTGERSLNELTTIAVQMIRVSHIVSFGMSHGGIVKRTKSFSGYSPIQAP